VSQYPDPRDQEQPSTPISSPSRSKLNRVQHSSQPPYPQAAYTSKDPQHRKGAIEDTSAKGNAGHHAKMSQDPDPRDQEQPITPTSNPSRSKLNRVQHSSQPPYAQAAITPKDLQYPKGAIDDTSAIESAGHNAKMRDPEFRDQEQCSTPTSNPSRSKLNRVQHSSQPPYAQVAHTSKDPQHPNGAIDDTSAKGSAPSCKKNTMLRCPRIRNSGIQIRPVFQHLT
jgi:hypothetical protein